MHVLNEKTIKNALDEKDVCVKVFDSIDSTNNEAKRMVENGKKGALLICALSQTAGRGRQGKSFYSPKKTGVYFTLVINRDFPLEYAVKATTAAAVAVCEAVEELTDKKPKIKWVNDIFLDGKKICGILTEAIPSNKKAYTDGLIIGIGINVATVDFPEEIKDIAGSLGCENTDTNLLVADVCNKILGFANDFENNAIIEKYRAYSFVIGREIEYEKDGKKHTATAVDIDKNCGLVVKQTDGKTQTLTSGEISIIVK